MHVQIGNVLGPDGKILRTRSGAPLRLMALLDEAVERAAAVVARPRPELTDAARAVIAHEVGIGAVKYADLSVAHDSEYVFDLDRMVSPCTGNTGPYLQYVVARIRSIFRKAGTTPGAAPTAPDRRWPSPAERALALALLGFGARGGAGRRQPRAAPAVRLPLRPGAGLHRVLRAVPHPAGRGPEVRASRLALCGRPRSPCMVRGLDLLGILAPEEM